MSEHIVGEDGPEPALTREQWIATWEELLKQFGNEDED